MPASAVEQRSGAPRFIALEPTARRRHHRVEIAAGVDRRTHRGLAGQQVDRGHVVAKLVGVFSPTTSSDGHSFLIATSTASPVRYDSNDDGR